MKNIFQYTILQYIHTPYLGENLNIGILFYFPEIDKFVFKHPENIQRIKNSYNNFEDKLIKKYLKEFTKIAKDLKSVLFKNDLIEVANLYFLPKDDSVLQFNKSETATYEGNNIDYIVKNYYEIYFEPYIFEQIKLTEIVKNEKYLISTFDKILEKNFPEKRKLFIPSFKFENEKTKLKADYFWQNSTGNIIKAISLDLKDATTINDKAIMYSGKLNYLSEEAIKKNFRIDLIISKPLNPDLFDEFSNSLEILNDSDINKRIILEEELNNYTFEAANHVIPYSI